jgi:hypothetical protein
VLGGFIIDGSGDPCTFRRPFGTTWLRDLFCLVVVAVVIFLRLVIVMRTR